MAFEQITWSTVARKNNGGFWPVAALAHLAAMHGKTIVTSQLAKLRRASRPTAAPSALQQTSSASQSTVTPPMSQKAITGLRCDLGATTGSRDEFAERFEAQPVEAVDRVAQLSDVERRARLARSPSSRQSKN